MMLCDYSRLGRSFTLGEILESIGLEVDIKKIKGVITSSGLFVSLDKIISVDSYFISKKTLFKWFVNLNLKLAEAGEVRLSSRQLGLLLGSLRINGRWKELPVSVVHFGQNFGLISPAWTNGYYVFPVARFFSFIPSTKYQIVENLLTQVENNGLPKKDFNNYLHNPLEMIIKKFPERTIDIIYLRGGIASGKRMTLEQVGVKYEVTRERIRQIEKGFWRKLRHPTRRQVTDEYLLNDLISHRGRLLIRSSDISRFWRLANKYFGIPISEVNNSDLTIVGITQSDLSLLLSPNRLFNLCNEGIEILNPKGIGEYLEKENRLILSKSEMKVLCNVVWKDFQKHLTKTRKVNFALRSIGKPAHYSAVTKEYNRLFSDNQSSEHNIHAILSREQNGIVWIGVRGTFALKEWGYRRPKQSLFTTTAEIVKNIYLRDKRPATFTAVSLEIGKYRKIVNHNSLLFAMNFNPEVEHLRNNTYMPKIKRVDNINNDSSDKLDRVFRSFEKSISTKDESVSSTTTEAEPYSPAPL